MCACSRKLNPFTDKGQAFRRRAVVLHGAGGSARLLRMDVSMTCWWCAACAVALDACCAFLAQRARTLHANSDEGTTVPCRSGGYRTSPRSRARVRTTARSLHRHDSSALARAHLNARRKDEGRGEARPRGPGFSSCSPEQIRTAVTALRGRRPRPLDDGALLNRERCRRTASGVLAGEDSNPQRQDQNLLCCQLHHPRRSDNGSGRGPQPSQSGRPGQDHPIRRSGRGPRAAARGRGRARAGRSSRTAAGPGGDPRPRRTARAQPSGA